MIIEISKAGFVNKGAELMLLSVLEKLRNRYPQATFTIAPSDRDGFQPYSKIVKLGVYPKVWFWKFGLPWGDFAAVIPKRLRERYGLILDREVDVVLDIAGFLYSDLWGDVSIKEFIRSAKRWKKNRTKIILLPQAFGPFEKPGISGYVKMLVEHVDLMFPREEISYRYVTEITGEQSKIKQYPDFTNLTQGTLPEGFDTENNRVAIIPNYRMIDKTDTTEGTAYISFMISCTRLLLRKNAKPFILVHEGKKDREIAESISHEVGGIPIIIENDALNIKGIIGACDATIGSRFHGLVSALSQSVPSLATGWSHKYVKLFDDYEFPEGVVSVLDSGNRLEEKIDMIVDPQSRASIEEKLERNSKKLKKLTEEMWAHVFEVIEKIELPDDR